MRHRNCLIYLFTGLILSTVVLAVAFAGSAQAYVRIMPVGDSITSGVGSSDLAGYRRELSFQLALAGHQVDFVGSVQGGPSDFDNDHEGHGGWQAEGGTEGGVSANIYDWLMANPADILLLHIGTNDIDTGDQDAAEIANILDEVDRYELSSGGDVTVILARIINRNPYCEITTDHNNAVEIMAEARRVAGDSIIIVDQEYHASFNYETDLLDEIHPNDTGYGKMASLWLSTIGGFLPAAAGICPNGMISYWKLDENGSPYNDSYGASDATCTDCPVATTGIVGGAQQFDGINDAVNVADNGTFEWTSDDSFSIEFWMKTDASSLENMVIVGRDEGSIHWWVGCSSVGNLSRFGLRDSDGVFRGISGTTPIADNQWHHIVAVRDKSTNENRIYVDGILENSLQHDYTGDFSGDADVNIGYLDADSLYRYEGIIDELAIYDRALALSEISQHYNDGLLAYGYCGPVAPEITSTPVTDASVGLSYIYDVEAIGSPAPTYALTSAPDGMTIDSDTGLIVWLPDAAGDYIVTVEASNSEGMSPHSFTITVSESVCPEGMISYWKLDENGSPYNDSYGASEATCTDCPVVATTGIVDGAQQFDGINDAVNVADNDTFEWTSDDSFSIEFWMRTDASSLENMVIVGRDEGLSHWWVGCSSVGNLSRFGLRDSDGVFRGISGTTPIADNQWHHIVAVRDKSTNENRIYVDGILENSLQHDYTGDFSGDADVNIGYLDADSLYRYEGIVDELAIYNQALSATEIQQHHADGLTGHGLCEVFALPEIISTPVTEAYVGNLYSYDVNADGIPAPSYTLTAAPRLMAVNNETGLIQWTPDVDDIGTVEVTVVATSVEGDDSQTFTIEVMETVCRITASAGANGSISPSGDVTVTHGSSQVFTITPDAGCHIADVVVDGASVGAVAEHTFTDVTSDHTISADFAQDDGDGDGDSDSDSDSDGGGCFISTGVFGLHVDPHVQVLRDFRNRFANTLNKIIVYLYIPVRR
jgi:lysophospholipase L1-like esterase